MAYDAGSMKSDKDCVNEGKLPTKTINPMTKNPFAGKGPKPTPTK